MNLKVTNRKRCICALGDAHDPTCEAHEIQMSPEMMTVKVPLTRSLRRRTKWARTATGKITPDCTVESEGYTEEEHWALHDSLVAGLLERYGEPAETTP